MERFGQYVVITKHTYHGPFPSEDAAQDYIRESKLDGAVIVVPGPPQIVLENHGEYPYPQSSCEEIMRNEG